MVGHTPSPSPFPIETIWVPACLERLSTKDLRYLLPQNINGNAWHRQFVISAVLQTYFNARPAENKKRACDGTEKTASDLLERSS